MIEKPGQGAAPSNLSIPGRYTLQPEIFGILATKERGAGGEIQLTDATATLLNSQTFTAVEYEGVTHDCGDKIGLLRANVALALKRENLGATARATLQGYSPETSRTCRDGARSSRDLGEERVEGIRVAWNAPAAVNGRFLGGQRSHFQIWHFPGVGS